MAERVEQVRVGMDLAEHASKRVSDALLQALSLCETKQQATMVAFKVVSIVAAQAGAVFAANSGDKSAKLTSPEVLRMVADILENPDAITRAGGSNG